MKIGIPKEVKDHEFRVALTPEGVDELIRNGHEVRVETTAGQGADFPMTRITRWERALPRPRKKSSIGLN